MILDYDLNSIQEARDLARRAKQAQLAFAEYKEEAIDKMPSDLSGGMKKRIGLARSIITDPELMLYDEPTTGLDPITSKEISQLIISLQRKLKMTSIIVTHDLICAEIIADRAIILKDSSIAYEGSIAELTNSDDPFLKNFFSHELIKV